MIIDAHVHLKHGDAAATEYSAAEIVRVMDAVGIARSVVFAMSTTARCAIEMAAQAVAQYPERLIPYAYALPSYERPVLEELDEAVGKLGFKGIKIHAGECRLTRYLVNPVLSLAGSYGVPCLIDLGGNLEVAERLARDFPETKLIIAHFGRYLSTDAHQIEQFIALAAAHPNIWLDCSGVVTLWKIEDAVRRLGAHRILWGTDGPQRTPDTVSFARLALRQIELLDLPDADKAMILGGSAAALLGLASPGR